MVVIIFDSAFLLDLRALRVLPGGRVRGFDMRIQYVAGNGTNDGDDLIDRAAYLVRDGVGRPSGKTGARADWPRG